MPKPIYTQIRIDEETFYKGKILAAIYDESFNKFMINALRNEIRKYESKYGELPQTVPRYDTDG